MRETPRTTRKPLFFAIEYQVPGLEGRVCFDSVDASRFGGLGTSPFGRFQAGNTVKIQRLLDVRQELRDQLARLETRRAMGVDQPHAGAPTAWRFHRTIRPSPRCTATYVEAVVRALPALAWSDVDREVREQLLPELHDAYANEDLDALRQLRTLAQAQDRTREELSQAALRRRLHLHVAWLIDRVSVLREPG